MDVFCIILVLGGCGYVGYRKYNGLSICPNRQREPRREYASSGTMASTSTRSGVPTVAGTPAVPKILNYCREPPGDDRERQALLRLLYRAIVSSALGEVRKRGDFNALPLRFQFVPPVSELDGLLRDRTDEEMVSQLATDPNSSGLMVSTGQLESPLWMQDARQFAKFDANWVDSWQGAPTQDEHFKHVRGVLPKTFFALSYMHWDKHNRSTSTNGIARLHPRTLATLKQQPIFFGGIEPPSKLWHDGCRHYGDQGLWGPITGLMFYTAASSTVLKIVDDHSARDQLWLYSFNELPEEKCIVKIIDIITGNAPRPELTICGLDVVIKFKGLLPPPVRIGGADRFWMLAELAIGIIKDGITATVPQAAQIVYALAWFRHLSEVIIGPYEELTERELLACCPTPCCSGDSTKKVKLVYTDCMGALDGQSPEQKIFRKVLHHICIQEGLDPLTFAQDVAQRVGRLARLWALVFLRGPVADEQIIRGEILEPMLEAHLTDESDRMPIYFLLEYMITAVFDDKCPFSQAITEYNRFGKRQPIKALTKIMDRNFGFRVTMPLKNRLADVYEWFGLLDTHAVGVASPDVIFHTWIPVTNGRCFAGVLTASSFKEQLRDYISIFNKKEDARVKWKDVAHLFEGSRSQLVLLRGEGVRAWIHGERPVVVMLLGSVRDPTKRRRAAPGWGDPIPVATRVAFKDGASMDYVSVRGKRGSSTNMVRDVEYKWVLDGGAGDILDDEDMALYQFVFDFSRFYNSKKASKKKVTKNPPALHLLTLRSCPTFEATRVLPIGDFDMETAKTAEWKNKEVKRIDVTLRMAAPTMQGFKDCSMEYWQLYDDDDSKPIPPRGQSMLHTAPWFESVFPMDFGELAILLRSAAWCDGSCSGHPTGEIPDVSQRSTEPTETPDVSERSAEDFYSNSNPASPVRPRSARASGAPSQ